MNTESASLRSVAFIDESRIYRADFSTPRKVPDMGTFFLPFTPIASILK
jgi:hypothetical protein